MTLSHPANMESSSILVLAVFMAAIILIDFHDIALPRGDRIGMAGPLVAAAVVVLGVLPALAMGVASTTAIQTMRYIRYEKPSPAEELIVRFASVVIASGVNLLLLSKGLQIAQIVVVPTTFLLTELIGRQMALAKRGQRSLRGLVAGNLFRQRLLFAAQLSVSVLTVLTFSSMGVWSTVPVVALLLLMRQAYAVLLEIRETYLTTVSVLVESAESQNPTGEGHADRTASIARSIASQCGLGSTEIERLNYAALLHDVDRIGDDVGARSRTGRSSALIAGNAFLSEVVPILTVVDGIPDIEGSSMDERDLLAGFIVALASDIDIAGREIAERDSPSAVSRVAQFVPARLKAQAVSAAVKIGYPVPAID